MQPAGLVHGGVYASIAETLASLGAAGIPTYVVTKGAGLPECLGQPALARA